MESEENVILVDRNDHQIGMMPKMEAHRQGILHRAFSVFIMNEAGEIMLQQRSATKYHSPLLWTNTCCSHQRLGESNIQAGRRRLMEEMGFTTELEVLFQFIYKAPFDNGLTEHELDHVLMGYYNNPPKINLKEVASWKWLSPAAVRKEMHNDPEKYTIWSRIIFEKFYSYLIKIKSGS